MGHCTKAAAIAIGTLALSAAVLLGEPATAGVVKSGAFYQVEVSTKAQGSDVTATIRITGKAGYHCNELYPWKLTVTPGAGVEMAKTSYGKGDAAKMAKEAVVFEVRYKAGAGAARITARLKLSCCDDKQCQMEQVDLDWPAR